MLHDTLNPADWRKHYETYDSLHVEGMSGRFLIRRDRLVNLSITLNDVSKAYQTTQRQREAWYKKVWTPLWEEMKGLAVYEQFQAHAKVDNGWWLMTFSKTPIIGWGWSFSWVEKPKKPLNLDFGQRFYAADKYSEKFSRRDYILGEILKGLLMDYLRKIYPWEYLEENQFSNKIVKINLNGDEYWYKIVRTRSGHPTWENFIWQNNKTEEINP